MLKSRFAHILVLISICSRCRPRSMLDINVGDTSTTYKPMFNRDLSIISFDPWVSTQDKHTIVPYTTSQLLPMLQTISTKFSKILIRLDSDDHSLGVSLKDIPEAVAIFNRDHRNSSTVPIELIIGDSSKTVDLARLNSMATNANTIFPGTVKLILMSPKHSVSLTYNISMQLWAAAAKSKLMAGPKIGVEFLVEDCWNSAIIQIFLGLTFPHVTNVFLNSRTTQEDLKLTPLAVIDRLTSRFLRCKNEIEMAFQHVEIINFGVEWRMSNAPEIGNLKKFVEFWQRMSEWSSRSNISVCFGESFDNPYKTRGGNSGWWKLINPLSSRSNYSFLEKASLIHDPDRDKSAIVPEQIVTSTLTPSTTTQTPTSPPDAGDFPKNKPPVVVLGSSLFVVAVPSIAVFLTVAFYVYHKMRKRKTIRECLTNDETNEFFNGGETQYINENTILDEIHKTAYNPHLEITKDYYHIDESSILGIGAFGVVFRATINRPGNDTIEVAAKTTRSQCPASALKGLMTEIKVLSYLGQHENIVNIIGAHTSALHHGTLYVFTELCSLGSLNKHLQGLQRPNENLGLWSIQICTGMEYLTRKHVIHADLATRNVLLTRDNVAKISDFGLSRRLYSSYHYVKSYQEPMPWRWMSPESLRRMEFNEKTDVWAFGVTLWEIYSLGDVPYPGQSWTAQFISLLEQGLRLDKTKYCEENVYALIMECCHANPSFRPSFSSLKEKLTQLYIPTA